jgi:predicted permease
MSLLDAVRHRVYVALRGEAYAREVEREMHFHLELDAIARASSGASGHDREIAPLQSFGNVTYYREEARRMTTLRWIDRLWQDVTYAWRGLKRSPGFTVTVVATLALGIGVNTAMFTLIDEIFVRRPSGVSAPDEIVRLYLDVSRPAEPGGRLAYDSFRYPHYRAIRDADSTLAVALFQTPDSTAVVRGDTRIPARRSYVSANYFALLGVRPQLGRFFTADEARIETPTPVVVLSDALWRTAFGADRDILGKTITVVARPFVVVGVAPPEFTGIDLSAVDIWIPANNYAAAPSGGEPWYETFHNNFQVLSRAATPGAIERLTTVGTGAVRSVHMRGYAFDSTIMLRTGPILRALGPTKQAQEVSISTRLAAVALAVFIIACTNVANLLLVRATRRQREIAVRRALGVSRARLYQQLLTESLVLSVLGGLAAVVFAFWAGGLLRRLMLPSVHWAGSVVNVRTVVFASVVALVTAILAGFAPAFQATRPDLVNSLKAGAREGAYRRSRLRSALLVSQTALSVLLLIGAGLFVQSLKNIRAVDVGYDVERLVSVRLVFATDPTPTEVSAALPSLTGRLRGAPGVEAVGYASSAPMSGYMGMSLFLPDRDSIPRLGNEEGASLIAVSPDYFAATGVRLVAGRSFTTGDRSSLSGAPMIVSQAMARVFWPGQSPLGKCVIMGKRSNPCAIVVGVVEDVHRREVIEDPIMQYYLPFDGDLARGAPSFVLRTSERDRSGVARIVTEELKRAFPRMSSAQVLSMKSQLEPQFRPWRLGATLFTIFGALALVIAAIGVYSVVAYAVSQRTHEMGIRLALGARLTDVVGLVAGESSRVVAVGVLLGIAAAIALGRLVASLLYGISARDPFVIAGAACVLMVIGLAASFIPGWRAARVDPSTALRAD